MANQENGSAVDADHRTDLQPTPTTAVDFGGRLSIARQITRREEPGNVRPALLAYIRLSIPKNSGAQRRR
jgi:hypothetical protein